MRSRVAPALPIEQEAFRFDQNDRSFSFGICSGHTRLRDGWWMPTFPNARYVMARDELAHFEANQPDGFRMSVLLVVKSGPAVAVAADHVLDDEIWLEPTPGYSPG